MASIIIGPGLVITSGTLFIPACTAVVGARFYARRVQQQPCKIDDWLMVPALMLTVAMSITIIVEFARKDMGYRNENPAVGRLDARSNNVLWPFELQEILGLGLTKLSLIFFFRRVFNTKIAKWYNLLSLAMAVITAMWTLAFFFSLLFVCGTTPRYFWTSAKVEKEHCFETQKWHNGFTISDVILDVIIVSMSIPIVWNLKVSLAKKFGVAGLFLFGLITIGASVTRAAVFLQDVKVRYDPNLVYEMLVTNGIYWSMLEVGLGLIAANLVALYGPLVSVARKSQLKTSSGTAIFRLLDSKAESEQRARNSNEGQMSFISLPSVPPLAVCAKDAHTDNNEEGELRDIHVVQTMEVTRSYV